MHVVFVYIYRHIRLYWLYYWGPLRVNVGFVYSLLKIVAKSEQSEDYGFAVRKDDTELLAKLNAAIEKVKANGTEEAIIKKWLR